MVSAARPEREEPEIRKRVNLQNNMEERKLRKTKTGIVSSDKMNKTITVVVERRLKHPMYGKYIRRSKKFTAHDEDNQCGIGDKVTIMETRPLSKKKRWRLVEVLQKAK